MKTLYILAILALLFLTACTTTERTIPSQKQPLREIVQDTGFSFNDCKNANGRAINLLTFEGCREGEISGGTIGDLPQKYVCCIPEPSDPFDNIYNEEGLFDCTFDYECVPLPDKCHPQSCINKDFQNHFEEPDECDEIYITTAAYKPEDCLCTDNRCVNFNAINQ